MISTHTNAREFAALADAAVLSDLEQLENCQDCWLPDFTFAS